MTAPAPQHLPPDRREPSMNRDAETVPARHETPDLAELRRLAEAATPGPWRTEYLMGAGNDLLTAIVAGRATPDDLRVIGSTLAERDGKFIVAAVNALPALLDAAAERDRLAGLLNEPRRSGCAVEIAGVRIAPCDERGQTADMRALAALNQKETR